jgi:hypothetical protein
MHLNSDINGFEPLEFGHNHVSFLIRHQFWLLPEIGLENSSNKAQIFLIINEAKINDVHIEMICLSRTRLHVY